MSAPAVAVSGDGKKTVSAWMIQRQIDSDTWDLDVYWTIGKDESMVNGKNADPKRAEDQNHPTVAIDEKGTAWCVWEDLRSGKPRIWGRTSEKDAKDQPLSSDADGNAYFPVVASRGALTVVVYEAGQDNVLLRVLADK